MAFASSTDVIVLAVGIVAAAVYLFRDQIFAAKDTSKSKSLTPGNKASGATNGSANPRDFVAKMKAGVSPFCPLHSSCVRATATVLARFRALVRA
jgi:NADPH-ferrihemoprotein reductase